VLLWRPSRLWLWLGLAGNAAVLAVYVASRTVGLPFGTSGARTGRYPQARPARRPRQHAGTGLGHTDLTTKMYGSCSEPFPSQRWRNLPRPLRPRHVRPGVYSTCSPGHSPPTCSTLTWPTCARSSADRSRAMAYGLARDADPAPATAIMRRARTCRLTRIDRPDRPHAASGG
jgi:hypothetical protein